MISYSIFDPTGNITALVETAVPVKDQPSVAAGIMQQCPAVEQVGFVQCSSSDPRISRLTLRMAGGEFCGNASMSAAALFLLNQLDFGSLPASRALRTSEDGGETAEDGGETEFFRVFLSVSGASRPVEVRLKPLSRDSFQASVLMPPARRIEKKEFSFQGATDRLPVVFMEGITHILIEPSSCFYALKEQKQNAALAVRTWCRLLAAEGLGLMFLDKDGAAPSLTPLVYIPGSETEFWENSCASGSSAAGMYLAEQEGREIHLRLQEPGGILSVDCDPHLGQTWLGGRVARTGRGSLEH